MADFLLDCSCGEQVQVTAQQAGGQVTCQCGKSLSVPTLRKLRHLPKVAEEAPPAAAVGWGLRAQLVSLGSVLTLLLFCAAGYAWATIPDIPTWQDLEEQFVAQRESQIANMSPSAAFFVWQYEYKPLSERGVYLIPIPDPENAAQSAAEKRRIASYAGIGAGVLAVLTVVAAVAVPGRASPRGT